MDSLVETITELVTKELAMVQSQSLEKGAKPSTSSATKGPRVLVVSGEGAVPEEIWGVLSSSNVSPVVLTWGGSEQDQLSASAASWSLEARQGGWSRRIGDYRGLCLIGGDLPTLGAIAALGAGGAPPATVTMAALSAGIPVFCEASNFERLRRHSARLAPGLTRAFEEAWRAVASFGVEFGQQAELATYLAALGGGKAATPAAAKTGGRDVVTT